MSQPRSPLGGFHTCTAHCAGCNVERNSKFPECRLYVSHMKTQLEELCEERDFVVARIQKLKDQLWEFEQRLAELLGEIAEEREMDSQNQEAAQ